MTGSATTPEVGAPTTPKVTNISQVSNIVSKTSGAPRQATATSNLTAAGTVAAAASSSSSSKGAAAPERTVAAGVLGLAGVLGVFVL